MTGRPLAFLLISAKKKRFTQVLVEYIARLTDIICQYYCKDRDNCVVPLGDRKSKPLTAHHEDNSEVVQTTFKR